MTHILIPSNFKEDTLGCLREVTQTFPGLQVNVTLFHAMGLSGSITDLLMLPREGQEKKLVSRHFLQECAQLKQELDEIASVEHCFFYGTTMAAFRNFLKANKTEFIVWPANYKHEAIDRLSQDPLPFLEKCGLPLISVSPRVPQPQPAMAQLL
ncbi:hypothetical protein EFA69_09125 [Rufibacter immobilis]|uniref:Universal stress protein n=1 Tax=Rufibacter immobilis TaxID=1348778 RepID=A0A3M9MVZ9_9BACT|nr:hypothetical protein [Rufibacter immobilis]RNI29706.1 hypothetical protein EFA69_09125 [Rufibacter immobilis]